MDISRSDLGRIIVAIDPAGSSNEDSDDTGIIVVARGPHVDLPDKPCTIQHCPGHGFVLEDRTCHVAPHEWARIAIAAYDDWKADRIVAEVNFGADMVEGTIHAVRAGVPFAKVNATRGKRLRAEPIAALSEQNRIHFLGVFPELEQQLNTWDPELSKDSPDRLDALVWGFTYLNLIGGQGAGFTAAWNEMASKQGRPVPAELRQLPKLQNEVIRKWAEAKCKNGENHRFFDNGAGEYHCTKCDGFLKQ